VAISEVPVGEAFLFDSNVILDLINRDAQWEPWSAETLADCLDSGPCFINPIIYSEVAVGFEDIATLEVAVPLDALRRLPLPYPAAFLAAKAHESYRRRGGTKLATLPDFFIGAHAMVERLTIVTRDARRYRQAFPQVKLVTPQEA
jgi:predicted nucleic acid-binding protein